MNSLSSGPSADGTIDIFNHHFENSVPIQHGKYIVDATSLDPETGEPWGGGLVAEFMSLNDANACFDEIMAINPKHEPTISRVSWELDLHEVVRESHDTVQQAREKAKRAFDMETEFLKKNGKAAA